MDPSTIESSKHIAITLGGKQRKCWYNFRACRALGMKGPGDSEGLQSALDAAVKDFAAAAKLIHAGLVDKQPTDTAESVEAALEDWDVSMLATFVSRLANGMNPEGEQSGNPPAK